MIQKKRKNRCVKTHSLFNKKNIPISRKKKFRKEVFLFTVMVAIIWGRGQLLYYKNLYVSNEVKLINQNFSDFLQSNGKFVCLLFTQKWKDGRYKSKNCQGAGGREKKN
eukprot:GEMP01050091.1.p2 GENE.GEMP01050091.1~~GEMP01050091.1.p2  ORF type:complete len:109 (+),score=1.28 GEMP01050091.1:715-1041(+)